MDDFPFPLQLYPTWVGLSNMVKGMNTFAHHRVVRILRCLVVNKGMFDVQYCSTFHRLDIFWCVLCLWPLACSSLPSSGCGWPRWTRRCGRRRGPTTRQVNITPTAPPRCSTGSACRSSLACSLTNLIRGVKAPGFQSWVQWRQSLSVATFSSKELCRVNLAQPRSLSSCIPYWELNQHHVVSLSPDVGHQIWTLNKNVSFKWLLSCGREHKTEAKCHFLDLLLFPSAFFCVRGASVIYSHCQEMNMIFWKRCQVAACRTRWHYSSQKTAIMKTFECNSA